MAVRTISIRSFVRDSEDARPCRLDRASVYQPSSLDAAVSSSCRMDTASNEALKRSITTAAAPIPNPISAINVALRSCAMTRWMAIVLANQSYRITYYHVWHVTRRLNPLSIPRSTSGRSSFARAAWSWPSSVACGRENSTACRFCAGSRAIPIWFSLRARSICSYRG